MRAPWQMLDSTSVRSSEGQPYAAGVERHHLHQAGGAGAAHRIRIEMMIFGEEHRGEKARRHADVECLLDDRLGDSIGGLRFVRAAPKDAGERHVREALDGLTLEHGAVERGNCRTSSAAARR